MKHQGRQSLLVYNFRAPPSRGTIKSSVHCFGWVYVGALVPVDGMHEKKHRLNSHLSFRQDTGIHHLPLKQTFREGRCIH